MQPTLRALAFAIPLFTVVSCTTVVTPPPAVSDPQTVFLVTHGKSSSLILPDDDSASMTRWAYGDWRYYALGRTGPVESAAAVLWPTPGALGRQQIATPTALPDLITSLGIGIDEAFPLRVERLAARALQKRLEEIFDGNRSTLHYNPKPRLEFVRHEAYTLVNSSNRKVAQWLRELGCTISGVPLLSKWRVEQIVSDPRSEITE